jgi:hypothetical protein
MGWTPPPDDGIERARVEVSATTRTGRSVHHADYDDWHRSGQERVPGPRRNERGKAVLRKQLRRDQVAPFFANLPRA